LIFINLVSSILFYFIYKTSFFSKLKLNIIL